MKMKSVLITLIATAILSAILLSGCGQKDASAPMEKMEKGEGPCPKAGLAPFH